IYGAGDGGELAVRELLNNGALDLHPFCFLDDDPHKHGERIHGVPVLGGLEELPAVVARDGVRRILIATKKLSVDVVRALHAGVAAYGLELFELDISVRAVGGNRASDAAAPSRIATRRYAKP
ncbi:MAG: nucleoside-diphosphate sugar epimerase/dehydratase, partial [Gemmatimonadales bacterium]